MISLARTGAPDELDAAKITELKTEFAATGAPVWNKPYIRNTLLQSSRSKCAYCEANIAEESKYMEVEHFRCKKDFPELVVEWNNLLPACKRCNGQKSDYNVEVDGMLTDPFSMTPAMHFYFQNYRLRWRDDIGRRTIDALYLNDSDRLVTVRMKIGETIAVALENIREKVEIYANGEPTVPRRNAIVRGMANLMGEAQPSSQYSALAATNMLSDDNFVWIKENLTVLGLWSGDLDFLYQEALSIALLP